jgi:hypothetical protein
MSCPIPESLGDVEKLPAIVTEDLCHRAGVVLVEKFVDDGGNVPGRCPCREVIALDKDLGESDKISGQAEPFGIRPGGLAITTGIHRVLIATLAYAGIGVLNLSTGLQGRSDLGHGRLSKTTLSTDLPIRGLRHDSEPSGGFCPAIGQR